MWDHGPIPRFRPKLRTSYTNRFTIRSAMGRISRISGRCRCTGDTGSLGPMSPDRPAPPRAPLQILAYQTCAAWLNTQSQRAIGHDDRPVLVERRRARCKHPWVHRLLRPLQHLCQLFGARRDLEGPSARRIAVQPVEEKSWVLGVTRVDTAYSSASTPRGLKCGSMARPSAFTHARGCRPREDPPPRNTYGCRS